MAVPNFTGRKLALTKQWDKNPQIKINLQQSLEEGDTILGDTGLSPIPKGTNSEQIVIFIQGKRPIGFTKRELLAYIAPENERRRN